MYAIFDVRMCGNQGWPTTTHTYTAPEIPLVDYSNHAFSRSVAGVRGGHALPPPPLTAILLPVLNVGSGRFLVVWENGGHMISPMGW